MKQLLHIEKEVLLFVPVTEGKLENIGENILLFIFTKTF